MLTQPLITLELQEDISAETVMLDCLCDIIIDSFLTTKKQQEQQTVLSQSKGDPNE